MKRKQFLTSISQAGILLAASTASFPSDDKPGWKIPPYLKPGDTIGITSPGGAISLKAIEPAVQKLKDWGYQVAIGTSIGRQDHTFGGSDKERTDDMQSLLDDPNVKAILCARGGYGSVRIIDRLDFSKFKTSPKWIIGFSDVCVIINHVFQQHRVASIHSKMCNSFPDVWETAELVQKQSIESINDCLKGKLISYNTAASASNKTGKCHGRLIGGNLRTLENLAGTASSPDTRGCILFIEDTGEYLYSIDRMLRNLLRSKKLNDLAGLIVGGFKIKTDSETENFGHTLEEIVLELTQPFGYPICFDFPIGHQKNNMALVCGAEYDLAVSKEVATLTMTKI